MTLRERMRKCRELRRDYDRLLIRHKLFGLTNHGATGQKLAQQILSTVLEHNQIKPWWWRALRVPIRQILWGVQTVDIIEKWK